MTAGKEAVAVVKVALADKLVGQDAAAQSLREAVGTIESLLEGPVSDYRLSEHDRSAVVRSIAAMRTADSLVKGRDPTAQRELEYLLAVDNHRIKRKQH